MIRPLCLLLIAAVAGCAPAAVPPQGASALAPSLPSATPVESDPADDAHLAALIAESVRIMTSPALRGNLEAVERQYGQIAQSGWGARLPAGRIADLIAGRDPAYTYFPVTVKNDPALETSTTSAKANRIYLANVLARWRDPDPQVRSLAVNTMVHELVHTLSSRRDALVFVFADGGRRFAGVFRKPPVASYTIGSVAQCTWLQEQAQGVELLPCVRTFGLRTFNSGSRLPHPPLP